MNGMKAHEANIAKALSIFISLSKTLGDRQPSAHQCDFLVFALIYLHISKTNQTKCKRLKLSERH